jgi:hypothetical protein
MTITTATGYPLILSDVHLAINECDLSCFCVSASLEPANTIVTITTFCGTNDYPSSTKWHLIARFNQSFATGSVDDTLEGALNDWNTSHTEATFTFRPHADTAVSAGNPDFKGFLIPQPYKRLGGDAGTAMEIDIDWSLDGPPVRDNTGTGSPLAHRAKPAPAKAPAGAPA